ncbi:MAG: hypothetical protein SVW51_15280, partial [Pseudomonadota bacterium]|nr:hypothetical protein [Pseudomonadota bacterium]
HPENERGEGVFYTDIPSSLLMQIDSIFESGGNSQQSDNLKSAGTTQQPSEQQQFSFDDE